MRRAAGLGLSLGVGAGCADETPRPPHDCLGVAVEVEPEAGDPGPGVGEQALAAYLEGRVSGLTCERIGARAGISCYRGHDLCAGRRAEGPALEADVRSALYADGGAPTPARVLRLDDCPCRVY